MKKVVTRAIILDDKKRILLARRARGDGEGKWELVGGKPEGDETPKEAVIREIAEELGLIFIPKLYLEIDDVVSVPGNTWKVYFYTGTVKGEIVIKEDENIEAKYFSAKEVEEIEFAFNNKQIVLDFFKAL